MSIRCELIDELLKDYPYPQDVLAVEGQNASEVPRVYEYFDALLMDHRAQSL